MNTTKYVYLTLLNFDSVFRTQIISWLNIYRRNGVDFSIIKAHPISQIARFNQHRAQIRDIRSMYEGKVHLMYIFPGGSGFGSFLNSLIISLILISSYKKHNQYLIQTRNKSFAKSLEILKSFHGSALRVIYDCRAASAEEYHYQSNLKGQFAQERYTKILREELRMLKVSDSVFYVSNNLRRYFSNQTTGLDGIPSLIYPCNADNATFHFSIQERITVRTRLGLNDRIVICYSGGMDLVWHKPDAVLDFFLKMRSSDPRIFIIVLSRDTDTVKKVLANREIDDNDYLALSLANQDVRPYLAASDAGLLFRDDVIMNNVASPTKFAEYLLCGLPVLISPGVGDFTQFVIDNDCGTVLDTNFETDYSHIINMIELWVDEGYKKRVAVLGNRNFSKQSLLPDILRMYNGS